MKILVIPQIIFLTFLLLHWNPIYSQQISANTNPYQHSASLDPSGRYNLTWVVDWTQRRVTFNVSVATGGYVGFGISRRDGKMAGADIVVGGVFSNGTSYFADRYAVLNQLPQVDPTSQDWVLHAASESGNRTLLSFSRPFDTCDPNYDIPITEDLSTLIWAIGEVDELQYHYQNRGAFSVYLLDPELTPDLTEFKRLEQAGVPMNMSRFPLAAQLALQPLDTMYWCHFFKTPTTTKQHIIGFSTEFTTETDRQHVHHLMVYRCRAPPGVNADELFGPAVAGVGSECFFPSQPNPLPTQYCTEVMLPWGVGGRPIFFPVQAGMAMSVNGSEYIMIQAHYDNPNNVTNQTAAFTVDVYYTSNLREKEVSIIPLGETIPSSASIIIPPNSLDQQIYGYCPAECLQSFLPSEGVTVFAAFVHTHLIGRGVGFAHFRGNQELPSIANSTNYHFNYQQMRLLIQERTVRPGDQLMMQCTYDSSPRNGSTVVGGHSTREEMCVGHLYYYTDQPIRFAYCRSELKSEAYMNFLGIRNTTWDPIRRRMMVSEPPEFAGLTVSEYANQHIVWDLQKRETLQRLQRNETQETQCPIVDDTPPTPEEIQAAQYQVSNPALAPGVTRYPRPPQCTNLPLWGKWSKQQAQGSPFQNVGTARGRAPSFVNKFLRF